MFSTFQLRFAQTLSIVMHPLLIPTIIFYIMSKFRPDMITPFNPENSGYLVVFIFISTYALPVTMILILYYLKIVSSIMLDTQKDRAKALGAVFLIYMAVLYMLFYRLSIQRDSVIILGSVSVAIIVTALITIFWKISIHSLGMAGFTIFCGMIALTNNEITAFQLFLASIIASGLLLSARLYLNKHTIEQILAGYAAGILIGLATAVVL